MNGISFPCKPQSTIQISRLVHQFVFPISQRRILQTFDFSSPSFRSCSWARSLRSSCRSFHSVQHTQSVQEQLGLATKINILSKMPGHDTNMFVHQPVDPVYICAICLDVYHNAVSACAEGHTFCQCCILNLQTCPTCRRPISNVHKVRLLTSTICQSSVPRRGAFGRGLFGKGIVMVRTNAYLCFNIVFISSISRIKVTDVDFESERAGAQMAANRARFYAIGRDKIVSTLSDALLDVWKQHNIRNINRVSREFEIQVILVPPHGNHYSSEEFLTVRVAPNMPWKQVYYMIMEKRPRSTLAFAMQMARSTGAFATRMERIAWMRNRPWGKRFTSLQTPRRRWSSTTKTTMGTKFLYILLRGRRLHCRFGLGSQYTMSRV